MPSSPGESMHSDTLDDLAEQALQLLLFEKFHFGGKCFFALSNACSIDLNDFLKPV